MKMDYKLILYIAIAGLICLVLGFILSKGNVKKFAGGAGNVKYDRYEYTATSPAVRPIVNISFGKGKK